MFEPIFNSLRWWGMLFVAILNAAGTCIAAIFAIIKVFISTKRPVNKIHETESEAQVNKAEATLRLAQAESIEFHDGISGYEIFQKLLAGIYELEQKLIERNRAVAELEDREFAHLKIIEDQDRVIKGYEGQRLELIGRKRLEQGKEQKENAS